MSIINWKSVLKDISKNSRELEGISKVYLPVLSWIHRTQYRGGCHDTSAAMYILLGELGIKSELCIGEVQAGEKWFDHSWLEVDGKIYDASVCMPNISEYAFPPVFYSADLDSGGKPDINYGNDSPVGLGDEAKFVISTTLGEYSDHNPNGPNQLWQLTKLLAKECGLKINAGKIRNKYQNVKRAAR